MLRSLLAISLSLAALTTRAATLTVDVRNARGLPMQDAVIYAMRDGRETGGPPAKRTAVMDQKNRMFVPHVLAIQTGTAVNFPNRDDVRHQVYSFSAPKKFQLPLYSGTPASPVVFDKPGEVILGCNIHDRMSAYIIVVDTPYFGTTGGDGHVTLPNLGAGRYVVHIWHPDLKADPTTLTLASSEQRELSVVVR